MTGEQRKQGIADAAKARAALYDTLSQLKVQLNYAQRFDDAVDETKQRIAETKRKKPLVFAAGVAAAAAAAGVVVWGVATAIAKQLD